MTLLTTTFRPFARVSGDWRRAAWAKHDGLGTIVYRSPGGQGNFFFSAVTRDSSGTPLAGCDVYLFLTGGNIPIAKTTSDSGGNYHFDNPGSGPFYLVAFKNGNPVGTTSNLAYPDPKPIIIPGTYTTAFPSTENPISEGGAWVNGLPAGSWNNVQTTPGLAFASTICGTPIYNDNLAHLTGFTANQSIQGVVKLAGGYSPPDAHEIELLTRFLLTPGSPGTARGYEFNWAWNGAYAQLVAWNGNLGDFTVLTPATYNGGMGTPIDGDIIKMTIVGSVITVYKNAVKRLDVTDTTWATGNPGIGFYPLAGATLASYGWKSIVASNI